MLSKQLRYLRQSQEISQVTLAQKLGVKKQSISNWENDNIMPSIELLERMADFFDVSTDYLLGRDENSNMGKCFVDVTGLTNKQIEHLNLLIEDLRNRKDI